MRNLIERQISGRRIAFLAIASLQVVFAVWAGSPTGIVLALLAIALALPWKCLSSSTSGEPVDASDERDRLRKLLITLAVLCAAASFFVSVSAHSDTPEGRAAIAERDKERRIERAMEDARERAEQVAEEAEREKERAFGEHCASSLTGSYRPLIRAVKPELRKPGSFDHVETHGSRVDANGHHRFTMIFRAENGFGGTNLETAYARVRSSDCAMISWEFGE